MRVDNKNNCERRYFVHVIAGFLAFIAVAFHSSSAILVAQEGTRTIVDEYRKLSQQLDDVISRGQILEIKNAVETLHDMYDKNPNFFEVIKDIAHGYYMLGDFAIALFYTEKALKLRDDKNLQMLRLQILMRTMRAEDITMNKAGAEEIHASVQRLLHAASYEADVLYTASVYFSIVGDERNYEKILSQFRSLYGFDKRYQHLLHMYTLIDAIDRQNASLESEKSFAALQSYDSHVWFVWLLLQYMTTFYSNAEGLFTDDGMLKIFHTYTEQLIQSDIEFLQAAAYVMRFNFFFSHSAMKEARTVAVQYSEHFPKRSDAWLRYGLVLYVLKDYGNALQAFIRADSDNGFVNFMYDATLKEALSVSSEGVEERAETRVSALVDAGTSAFSRGDMSSAQKYARRALFIMPLSIKARILIADVHIQQGDVSQAEEELSLLENINGVPSRVLRQLASIRAKIRAEFDDYPAIRALLNAGSFSRTSYDPIAWNIRIKTTVYNGRGFNSQVLNVFDDDTRYTQSFFTQLLEYSLTKFSTIRIADHKSTETSTHTQNIELEFSYSERNGVFSAKAHLINEKSLEHIATFVERKDGNDRVQETLDVLAQRLYNALPLIVPVLATSRSTVVLGEHTMRKNFLLPIFDNGSIQFSARSPYFTSSGQLIGFAKIEKTLPNSTVATLRTSIDANSSRSSSAETEQELRHDALNILSRLYGEKTFSIFDMRSRINRGDIAIVLPAPWVDDEKFENAIENLSENSARTTLLTTMRISLR